MRKLNILALSAAIGCVFLGVSACSNSKSGGEQTATQLAGEGETIFQQHCETCHGENGQKVNGSALMGQRNVLKNYGTAQGLYDYISKQMPDDNPGSLTSMQYLQVESYLLLQGAYLKPGTPFNQNILDKINLGNQ